MIRKLLLSRLSKRTTFETQDFIEEVPVRNGLVRADIVVCSDKLECFEIKSERDTLKRLFNQACQYEPSFDYLNLVCASKHVSNAMQILPTWWGIIEVTPDGKLKTLQRATLNPYVCGEGMIDLLENEESKALLLNKSSIKGISRLNHAEMRKHIAECSNIETIRSWVKNSLRARHKIEERATALTDNIGNFCLA